MKIFYFILFLITTFSAIAEDSNFSNKLKTDAFGLSLNYLYTKHLADFRQLPDAPNCCPQFSNANGSGFEISLLYHYALSKSIAFSPIIGFIMTDGRFKSSENKIIIIDSQPYNAEIEHSLSTELSFLFIEQRFIYNLAENFNFFTSISLDYLFEATFEQKETLIKPENRGTFENGKRTRNQISGNISNISKFNFFLKAGLNYELPLNSSKSLSLVSNATISAGLNNLLKESKWSLVHISLGFSLLYNFYQDYATPIDPKHRE